jgi:hypothetical protein
MGIGLDFCIGGKKSFSVGKRRHFLKKAGVEMATAAELNRNHPLDLTLLYFSQPLELGNLSLSLVASTSVH